MRRRLNYANVTATLALFFAMSGGALAAKHYLLNSTKQISPKVLKSLTGKTGPAGTTGKEGTPGKEGKEGKEGPRGKEGTNGTNGTARAYAQTTPGAYVAGRTKGFTGSPTSAGTGIWCLTVDPATGINPSTVAAVADTEFGNTSGAGFAEVRGFNTGDCAEGQFDVHTFNSSGAASSSIAFMLIVP